MSQIDTSTPAKQSDHKPPTITITVNETPVTFEDAHQTGLSIKEAAISQTVPIQLDFVLSEVLNNDKQKPIADDKKVEVKDGDEFWAIPGDDNS